MSPRIFRKGTERVFVWMGSDRHLKPLTPGGEAYAVHPPFYSGELIEIFQYSIFIVSLIKYHLAAVQVKFRLINHPGLQ